MLSSLGVIIVDVRHNLVVAFHSLIQQFVEVRLVVDDSVHFLDDL